MITPEKLATVQTTLDRLMAQGKTLFADVAETAQDRARLLKEAEEREQTIEKLNQEVHEQSERIRELETRNHRLVEDNLRLETQCTDATRRLDLIRNATDAPARGGNSGSGGESSVVRLPDRSEPSNRTEAGP